MIGHAALSNIMMKSCLAMRRFAALLIVLLFVSGISVAQQTDAQKLYNSAKKHLEQGAYTVALSEAEAAIQSEPNFAPSYTVKGLALVSLFEMEYVDRNFDRSIPRNRLFARLKQAVESFEQYLKLQPHAPDAGVYQGWVYLLKPYAELSDERDTNRTIFFSSEFPPGSKAQIVRRREPQFTEEARVARVRGSIRVLAVLDADGTVKNIFVIKPLGYGLNERAVDATSKIEFVPAQRDGHPVAQAIEVIYNFQTGW